MVTRLQRALLAMEAPILAAHDLPMWGYVVLSALATGPTRTQAALAQAIRADKTRIIPVLDDLQERGLIERRPDPRDRRVRLLAITPAGRDRQATIQEAIRAEEERLLGDVPAGDAERFLAVLRRLSAGS